MVTQRNKSFTNKHRASSIDDLLSSWLQEDDAIKSEQLLLQFISEYAEPMIKAVITQERQRNWLDHFTFRHHEAADIRNEIIVRLLESLQRLKSDPHKKQVGGLGEDIIRAVRKSISKDLRRDHSVARVSLDDLQHAERYELSSGADISDDSPLSLEELVTSSSASLNEASISDSSSSIVQRLYLQQAWAQLCGLPFPQRFAFLLSLKDEQGNGLLALLPAIGIASESQIAEALEMSLTRLSELWGDLPLHDAQIAKLLGLTRQAIVNYRQRVPNRLARLLLDFRSNKYSPNEQPNLDDDWLLIESEVVQPLRNIDSLEKMAKGIEIMERLPAEATTLPDGLNEAKRRITFISSLARDYFTRMTPSGQVIVLEELRRELEAFRDAMAFVKPPVGPNFQPLTLRWLYIAKKKETECRKRLVSTPILNPFIAAGNPLQPRDHDLFKGRKDIIIAIEENIINPSQRPALLLYGRRRIGKSSTLLNLPVLLSSRFVPIYIDCQNAKWRDSDAMFCYQLVNVIYGELFQRTLHEGLSKPQIEEFEKHAFTRFDDYLDRIEDLSLRMGKQLLLTFDEYERMEEGVRMGSITREVFNQLRHIVQHRERLVVLFSGSHRFEEARTVNWADYLINVKTLELSYLAPDEARELVERPVPGFKLRYEPSVVERILQLTHCQPYLLQAVASDLVNYLNGQKRQIATLTDLEVAVEKVLVTAQAYFHYLWSEDCNDAERELLHALSMDEAIGAHITHHQSEWRRLHRKEIVELQDRRHRFAVELFRRWILKNQIAPSLQLSTNQ